MISFDKKLEMRVYKIPGIKPDVRFKIFGTHEFHVHSAVLKLYSAFFRKFLDSPDKSPATSPPAPFRYEWISKVDDDGTWSVVAAAQSEASSIGKKPVKDVSHQVEMFDYLLRVMYGETTPVYDFSDMKDLTQMADYYRALPVLSGSLIKIFDMNRPLLDDISSDPVRYLPIAVKLRSSELFGHCLVLSMTPWHSPRFKAVAGWSYDYRQTLLPFVFEPQLNRILEKTHLQMAGMVTEVQQRLMDFALQDENWAFAKILQTFAVPFTKDSDGRKVACLPQYYCTLDSEYGHLWDSDLRDCMREILVNNLQFEMPRHLSDGPVGDPRNCDGFLFAEVDYRDLPWDMKEEDW